MSGRDELYYDDMCGTCGTMCLANLPRESEARVKEATKYLKDLFGKDIGVVTTAVKNPTALQEKWFKRAGWTKTLQYTGQYGGFGYDTAYPMQHWALVLRPWKKPKKVVAKKKVVK